MFKQTPFAMWLIAGLITFVLSACDKQLPYEADANAEGHSAATPATIKANQQVLQELAFADQRDFENARRGLIAQEPGLVINTADGEVVWDMSSYDFIQYQGIDGQAPASVNPSLWRQAALNNIHGLFKLTEGIYQLRSLTTFMVCSS